METNAYKQKQNTYLKLF